MVDNSESCCKTGTGKCDESESHNESESKSSGCCKSGSNSSSCGDSGCTGSGCSGSDASLKKYLPYIVGIALAVFLLIGIGITVLGYGSDQGLLPQKVVSDSVAENDLATATSNNNIGQLTLKVSIPCPGHAGIIIGVLKKLGGVIAVEFRMPNLFDVSYDTSKTTQQDILNLKIFQTYAAKTVNFI